VPYRPCECSVCPQTFHRTHYRPDNAHLYIVGDVDVAQAEDLIRKYFGHLESAAPPAVKVRRERSRFSGHQGGSACRMVDKVVDLVVLWSPLQGWLTYSCRRLLMVLLGTELTRPGSLTPHALLSLEQDVTLKLQSRHFPPVTHYLLLEILPNQR
jgi:hypothetical protein